jgi:hypothetical protein
MSAYYQRKLSEKLSSFQDGEVRHGICWQIAFCVFIGFVSGIKPCSPLFKGGLHVNRRGVDAFACELGVL